MSIPIIIPCWKMKYIPFINIRKEYIINGAIITMLIALLKNEIIIDNRYTQNKPGIKCLNRNDFGLTSHV